MFAFLCSAYCYFKCMHASFSHLLMLPRVAARRVAKIFNAVAPNLFSYDLKLPISLKIAEIFDN